MSSGGGELHNIWGVAILHGQQHNTSSCRRQYRGMALPRILHEYLILWRKREVKYHQLVEGLIHQQQRRAASTWRVAVRVAVVQLGGSARLDEIYGVVYSMAPERADRNEHWKAKVRQVLHIHVDFAWVERKPPPLAQAKAN